MRKYIVLLLIAVAGFKLNAQGEFTLYNMNKSLPQSTSLNPAFFSEQVVVAGLPVMSSVHLQYDGDPFSFSNMFTKNEEGMYQIDYDKISDNLNDRNTIRLNADVSLFYLGLNLNRNHFSLGINQRVNSSFSIDDDLANLIIYGNGHSDLIDKNISFNETTFNQNAYFELGLGYAREVNEILTIGIKFKYLLGITNVQLKDIDAYVVTSYDSIQLVHSGFDAYTSGESYFEDDGEVMDFLEDKNTGWAIDFGIDYWVSNKLSVSAAVTDLGQINWKTGTNQYHYNPVNYSFSGFEIEKIIDDDESDDIFESEMDSLEVLFTAEEIENVSYKTKLTANVYAGINYEFYPGHSIGATAGLYMIEDNSESTFAAYYNYHPGNLFNGVVNLQVREGYVGLGLGASMKFGVVQVYATTESLSSLFKPSNASFVDARVGVNMVFGKVYR